MGLTILLSLLALASQKVTLRNGEVIEDRITTFRDSVLLLETAGRIPASQVQGITFLPSAVPAAAFSDTLPVRKILEIAAEATKRFKDVSGIILLEDETNILHRDGTRMERYHFIGKILKPDKRDWAIRRIGFDESRTKVSVLLGRTIHPDGSVSWLDPSTIKISSPAMSAAYFYPEKTLSFTLPKAGVGDIVECIVEERVVEPFDINMFEPRGFLQSYEPTVKSRFKVVIPDSLKLNYFTRSFPDGQEIPTITTKQGNISYEWELENMPGIVREPRMTPPTDIIPVVLTTLFENWDYRFDIESKWQLDRMQATPEIRSLTREIVEPAETIDDSIAFIYHWVQKNIRYVCIKGSEAAGHSGHAASLTLKNGYGDCTDKSILLATMLRAISVDAYPIFVNTNRSGTPEYKKIPVAWANHAINQVRLPDRTFALDPVGEAYRYPYFPSMDHGILCVNSIARSIDSIPVPPPESNAGICKINMALDTSGTATVEFEKRYTGAYEAHLRRRWKYTRKSEHADQIEQIISEESPGAELDDYEIGPFEDLSQQFYIKWNYRIENYPIKTADLLIFKIPGLEEYQATEAVSSATRLYDIVYSTSYGVEQQALVRIPEGHEVAFLPMPIEIECKYASYKGKYQKISGTEIQFTDKFSRWARVIDVEDYQEYKDFLTQVADFAKQQIFLKKTE
jgi:hypothetical protein